jgi:hypothetical protein
MTWWFRQYADIRLKNTGISWAYATHYNREGERTEPICPILTSKLSLFVVAVMAQMLVDGRQQTSCVSQTIMYGTVLTQDFFLT